MSKGPQLRHRVGPVHWKELKAGEFIQIVSSTCETDIAFQIVRPPPLPQIPFLPHMRKPLISQYAVFPDGQHFLVNASPATTSPARSA